MTTTETIYVENIKCGGCMKSIKEALLKMPGVQGADVYKEEDKVCVMGMGTDRSKIIEKLAALGYPERGNNSLLHKAKSFISCATGKMSE
jgi:copper chaperone CopZ